MTIVKDLIKQLKAYDPNSNIYIGYEKKGEYGYLQCAPIELNDEGLSFDKPEINIYDTKQAQPYSVQEMLRDLYTLDEDVIVTTGVQPHNYPGVIVNENLKVEQMGENVIIK